MQFALTFVLNMKISCYSRNLMRASVVGMGLCAVAFGYMAAGKFKKS